MADQKKVDIINITHTTSTNGILNIIDQKRVGITRLGVLRLQKVLRPKITYSHRIMGAKRKNIRK